MAGGTGNWNDASNWSATTGGASGASFPVAGDAVAFDGNSGNAAMTVNVASACASLVMSGGHAGTLTFNANLTTTSTVTFLPTCTIAGTAGTLIPTGTMTATSGGKTLTCNLQIGSIGTNMTMADNWVVNGLVTVGPNITSAITGAGKTMTCNGGLHVTAASGGGTAKYILAGGTWDGTGGLVAAVELAGNVTVSGTVTIGTNGSVTYTSGTITTTGSTVVVGTGSTFNTAGVTWNNLTLAGVSTWTLSSDLAWSGAITHSSTSLTVSGAGMLAGPGNWTVTATGGITLTLNNTGGLNTTGTLTLPNGAYTFAGSAGFTVGTLTTATLGTSRTHTLTFGNTYTVTSAFSNAGTTPTIRQAIKSSVPGGKVVLTLTPGASLGLVCCDPTDIDSSGGAMVVSIDGVITNTDNWSGSITSTGAGPVIGCSFITGVAVA